MMARMPLGYRLLALLTAGLIAIGLAAPAVAAAPAAGPAPTTLTMSAPAAYAGSSTNLSLDLVDASGAPVPGAPVTVQRRSGGVWAGLGTVTTDEAGHAVLATTLAPSARDNGFRATYAGDGVAYGPSTSGAVQVPLRRRSSVLTLGGPTSVVDER